MIHMKLWLNNRKQLLKIIYRQTKYSNTVHRNRYCCMFVSSCACVNIQCFIASLEIIYKSKLLKHFYNLKITVIKYRHQLWNHKRVGRVVKLFYLNSKPHYRNHSRNTWYWTHEIQVSKWYNVDIRQWHQ